MADRPIIFSAPMVRALLAGRKTQTRRILKPQPPAWCANDNPGYSCLTPPGHIEFRGHFPGDDGCDAGYGSKFIRLPFEKGDRLWVKETWQAGTTDQGMAVAYRADGHRYYPEYTGKDFGAGPSFDYDAHPAAAWKRGYWIADVEAAGPWGSPLHLPRWASRLTLIVDAVKIERLQSISHDDAIAEGIEREPELAVWREYTKRPGHPATARECFASLWQSINVDEGKRWEDNPWIVALTFRVIRENIDRIAA